VVIFGREFSPFLQKICWKKEDSVKIPFFWEKKSPKFYFKKLPKFTTICSAKGAEGFLLPYGNIAKFG
jgi:hypothetical protein